MMEMTLNVWPVTRRATIARPRPGRREHDDEGVDERLELGRHDHIGQEGRRSRARTSERKDRDISSRSPLQTTR